MTEIDNENILKSFVKAPVNQIISIVNEIVDSGDIAKSISLYNLWIRFNSESPLAYVIYFNLAVLLSKNLDLIEAENCYRKALAIKPDFNEARLNLGNLFESQGSFQNAIEQWRIILDITNKWSSFNDDNQKQIRISALNSIGRVLDGKKQYAESEIYLAESLQLNPKQQDVLHHWIGVRQRQCKWPVYAGMEHISKEFIESASGPLFKLALTDDPKAQLETNYNFVSRKYLLDLENPLIDKNHRYNHLKIRIGYVSSDLRNHAVSFLTVPLFEKFDREKFEVFAFSWSKPDQSLVRQRILNNVTEYVSISNLNDEEAAKIIQKYEIDILVDLHGLTLGGRPNIFTYRPAPISITYLGLPATTGHPHIDYILADEFLIPQEMSPFYSEKPLYLTPVFQISDDQRPVAAKPSRASKKLPENAYVFCCFNNNYKFTAKMFRTWLNILKRVPQGVLWLLADNKEAREQMTSFARIHHIDTDRLIFADRVMPDEYLAQFQCADLFLDAFPFNGGTTANDALYMDLPIITLSGMAFASRMAGALLHALELDELIATSYQEYEDLAVRYAQDAMLQEQIKAKLKANKIKNRVFDSGYLVQQVEAVYENLVQNLH